MKLSVLALAAVAYAQTRPTNTSICDYYTTALLKNNTGANQYMLLELVVNTAVIGNYTKPNVGIKVPGILAKGTVNGTEVNLAPYFNGMLASTNNGGDSGVSVNFLDDGGAVPIMMNKPANGTSSAQYRLLTHLYEYFGALLGCTQYGKTGFPAYAGDTNMYEVHKFMALDHAEVTYFIQQVGLSAASFGVTDADVQVVAAALTNTFNYRCSPPVAVIPKAKTELQAICIASDCPVATASATCGAYEKVVEPKTVTPTSTGGSSTSSTTTGGGQTSSTSSIVTTPQSQAGVRTEVQLGMFAAFLLSLF